MTRRRSILSDATKIRLAQLQGAGDRAQPGYYGNLTSEETGNFVKYALYLAEQTLSTTASPQNSPQRTP